ncbi:MAG: MmcQ/YjbR family DNA-binding protein [Bacteroidales bacterium]|nr:MmcQ/YjbR family DNA-binding protein [Bacteroidales bacterium]
MNIELIREYCLQKPFTNESFPFDDSTLAFKLMGKIFACLDLNRPNLVVLKCDPEYALELRQRYEGVEAAWHWNKKHWNQVYLNRDVSETLVYSLIDHSYELVFNKIPKRVKNEFIQF